MGRNVRTADQLRHSLFGWTEGADRDLLWSPELEPLVDQAVSAIEDYLGVQVVELADPGPD